MSNSAMVSHTRISPNRNHPRNHVIDKITVHHMAIVGGTAEGCGEVFAPASRRASSNYGIGVDGRVGLYVDEGDRSWASSSAANDNRAVTIEVANDGGAPDWHVSDASWNALVELCADICRRNGIARLNWTGDAGGNLTCHYMFAATACPGPHLKGRMAELAGAVNAKLGSAPAPQPPAQQPPVQRGLAEDGLWGGATTKRAQEIAGLVADGEVWHQHGGNKSRLRGCIGGWKYDGTLSGSPLIRWMQQNVLGITADGLAGKDFANAMIRRYGNGCQDGRLDYPSTAIKGFQRALNEGRF